MNVRNMWSQIGLANIVAVISIISFCNGTLFASKAHSQIHLPMRTRKPTSFMSLSPDWMKTMSLKVMKTVRETLPNICLDSCKKVEGCSNVIHCLDKEQCPFWTDCTQQTGILGTCYLMGTKGEQLDSKTNCKISKPDKMSITLSEKPSSVDNVQTDQFQLNRFFGDPIEINIPKELLGGNQHETAMETEGTESQTDTEETKAEPKIPTACLTEPSFRNQGAVRKQKSKKPGYPVVIEYECGQQGEWTYKYVTGTTRAKCDVNGKWTLAALLCIPTNCYNQQMNGRDVTKALYAGSINKTSAGLMCQKWTTNKPHSHGLKNKRNTQFPADASADEAGNKCRDPDGESKPWCYTTSESKRWDACNVSRCIEGLKCGTPPYQPGTYPIRTELTNNYVHVTYSCLDGLTYSEGDVMATCNMTSGVWKWPKLLCYSRLCYYHDSALRGKAIYRGNVNETKGGKTCQRFDSQTPHKHGHSDEISEFPGETSLADIGNKCRDGDGEGAPWCYTTDPDKRWDHCDIPECLFDLKQHRVIHS